MVSGVCGAGSELLTLLFFIVMGVPFESWLLLTARKGECSSPDSALSKLRFLTIMGVGRLSDFSLLLDR